MPALHHCNALGKVSDCLRLVCLEVHVISPQIFPRYCFQRSQLSDRFKKNVILQVAQILLLVGLVQHFSYILRWSRNTYH